MNCLELFSGTHSFGKCCESLGYDVVSLDIDGRATINKDILLWDYKVYPKDHFDIIWASPPCDRYSHLNYSWIGRKPKRLNGEVLTHEILNKEIQEADKLVIKTLEIINYFKPEVWFIENPNTSRLKDRPCMRGLNYYIVDYCRYADYGYKKRTRIWTNRKNFKPLLCKKECGQVLDNGSHITDVCWLSGSYKNKKQRLDLRHRVPPNLIYSLLLD